MKTEKSLMVAGLQNAKFKEAKVVEGDSTCPFYLDVTYTFENLYGIYELHIPKIRMGSFFQKNQLPNIVHNYNEFDPAELFGCCCNRRMTGVTSNQNFIQGHGDYLIIEHLGTGTKDDKVFYIKTIKEKDREMTLEEIEKELGHKIKIVAK